MEAGVDNRSTGQRKREEDMPLCQRASFVSRSLTDVTDKKCTPTPYPGSAKPAIIRYAF